MLKNYYEENLQNMHEIMTPGTMLYMNPTDLMTGKEKTVFYIKEEPGILNRIPKISDIQTIGIAFYIAGVIMPIIYIKINGIQECLYEMFVNYYSTDGSGERAIYNLMQQDYIMLSFMTTKPEIERVIEIENGLKQLAEQVKKSAMNYYPGWTMTAFDKAKQKIILEYPERSLWEKLMK